MTTQKIFVAAMSGGVDSSVAAAIYVNAGHKVIAATLKMKNCDDTKEKAKACCGLDDNLQARLAADKLGIKHYFIDTREEFREKVLRHALTEYVSGRTPNPCVLCNYYLKFGALMKFAKDIGAEGIITGHYAIIRREENQKTKIFKGVDDNKNQTYFLCGLTQEQIDFSYMPLGELTKTQVRKIASELSLPNAKKEESQDACFGYKGETFAQTLSRSFSYPSKEGNIVDVHGKILGRHHGIENFTIGQRRGLGVALGEPAFVTKIDPISGNVLVSCDHNLLLVRSFTASKMNYIDFDENSLECEIQTRYRQTPQKALVAKLDNSKVKVDLAEPLRAVTPGQALAVYRGEQLIAGGWIDKF
ncbi:MAG TPA: tRNA 2-thiouridine(34) synthase MnmA [Lentisphaeria bacterium]|nr:MAG: tRNA 2-thiouridine(34) synthase MnmA [Lentisphaerae bacterium GWF2_38_69]HBM15358.1 tRNA 2-thiouridine(34) synthase MnmA [Lentisphaeria bacterium]